MIRKLTILLAVISLSLGQQKGKCGVQIFTNLAGNIIKAGEDIGKNGYIPTQDLEPLAVAIIDLVDDCFKGNFPYPAQNCYPSVEDIEKDLLKLAADIRAEDKDVVKLVNDFIKVGQDLISFRNTCIPKIF